MTFPMTDLPLWNGANRLLGRNSPLLPPFNKRGWHVPQLGCGGSGIATYESLDVRNLGELEHPGDNVVPELQIRFVLELGRAISTLRLAICLRLGSDGEAQTSLSM